MHASAAHLQQVIERFRVVAVPVAVVAYADAVALTVTGHASIMFAAAVVIEFPAVSIPFSVPLAADADTATTTATNIAHGGLAPDPVAHYTVQCVYPRTQNERAGGISS